ncbi:ABC transporter ATP-binding protein [Lactobacillus sp. ESL0791]|uniref:ABC transporter ATP-binding protein n=1 Tax=Lactobacillus sp. ESL0791 TaxID=2983234 RepID=UPI0023F6AF8C|nr:ABC transporter ATP-binding protein [Lactobacillus sp. ESL0791]MDF7639701.1 ABC transporter ATP-binding protein [Lactobacillus sp. ESL0791]
MKYMWKYLKMEPWRVSLVVVLQAVCSLFRIVNALFNVWILNALVKLDLRAFITNILLNIALFAVMTVFLVFNMIEQVKTVQYLSLHLKQDIVRHLASYPIKKFQKQDTGVYASWLTNDMNLIEERGFTNLLQSVQLVTDPLFAIIALIKFNWTFLPLVLLMTILTVFLPQLVKKRLAESNLSTTKESEKVVNTINDGLRGFSTLAIFGMEHQLEERITNATLKLIKAKVHQVKYETCATSLAEMSNIMGQMVIGFWTGLLVFQKAVSIGVFSSASSLSYDVFNSLAVAAPVLTQMRSLDTIFAKYHLEEPINEDTAVTELEPVELAAKGLQTSYRSGQNVFQKALSFTILPKQKVAIAGDSGSGKSTLLKLLSGQLRSYSGRLTFAGREMKMLNYRSIKEKLVYVDQTPYLFDDTIRYNLELGQKFTDEEINAALAKADLLTFVNSLPEKLATRVGEGGASLSGGQKQRLALARGFLRHRELFLLDESTSSLDKESAIKIENDFLRQPDITVVFVSHQLHAENKNNFDQIIRV